VPQEVDEWIEELEECIRELEAEADQQRQLPPSAQPLALPAPAQQRTKAAWRKWRWRTQAHQGHRFRLDPWRSSYLYIGYW